MSAARVTSAEAANRLVPARVRVTEEALENTNVRAPFDGVVIRKRAEVGETVSPFGVQGQASREGGAIATIADLAELEVQTEVSENSVAKLSSAMPGRSEAAGVSGSGLQGPVAPDFSVRGSGQGDRRSACHHSQCRRPCEAGDDRERHVSGKPWPRPTMGFDRAPAPVRTHVAPPAAPIVVVPKRAVTEQNGQKFVWVVTGATAVPPRRHAWT